MVHLPHEAFPYHSKVKRTNVPIPLLFTRIRRGGWCGLHCACLTSTFRFAIPLFREWPRLHFTARIERAPFHRARSASKKGTWPLPPHPSKLAHFSPLAGGVDLGAQPPAAGSLHRAGCEAGWVGRRQDPRPFLIGDYPWRLEAAETV